MKSPSGLMANVLDCNILVSEFQLRLRYYVHFRIKTTGEGMNPLNPQLWVKEYHYWFFWQW